MSSMTTGDEPVDLVLRPFVYVDGEVAVELRHCDAAELLADQTYLRDVRGAEEPGSDGGLEFRWEGEES